MDPACQLCRPDIELLLSTLPGSERPQPTATLPAEHSRRHEVLRLRRGHPAPGPVRDVSRHLPLHRSGHRAGQRLTVDARLAHIVGRQRQDKPTLEVKCPKPEIFGSIRS